MHELQLDRAERAHLSTQDIREGAIKLNLGGRGTRIPGFQTVDLSAEHDVDVKSDVSDLPFADNSVSEIYASQILEHFSHLRTRCVLEEWYRVLARGGKISIGVPDFQRAVDLFKTAGLVDYIVNLLYGDQVYDMAYHYAPFTFSRLASLMDAVGFRDIRRIPEMPYNLKDCSSLVCNLDKKNVSLCVEAFK